MVTLNKLLGLEQFPIRNTEIMKKLQEGYLRQLNEIEFSSGGKSVKLKLHHVSEEGIMKWY
ncbi:MAG: hypothetical protein AB1668_07125 [Nanoarchaeota archaeon]